MIDNDKNDSKDDNHDNNDSHDDNNYNDVCIDRNGLYDTTMGLIG